MIEKLFNHPHILHQTAIPDSCDIPNSPIAGHIDNGGSIVLSQEGRDIVVDRLSVPELCQMLEMLADLVAAESKLAEEKP
jgi:hypothetical protein